MSAARLSNRKLGGFHHPVSTSHFDFDQPLLIEDLQENSFSGYVRPLGGFDNDGPYEFHLDPQGDTWLMLNTLTLETRCQIVKGNGTDLADTDYVAPINNLGGCFWEKVAIELNETTNNGQAGERNHYKNILETLLSYDADARETHLQLQLFCVDSPGKYDDHRHNGDNAGFKHRYRRVAQSKVFDMISPISSDFLRTSKHLAPGNKLKITLTKAPDAFLLNTAVANPSFKFKFKEMKLRYNRIRINMPTPRIERYPFTRSELKRFTVPDGILRKSIDIQSGGVIPKMVCIFMVDTARAVGSYALNPFNMQHFNLKSHCLRVNGQMVPSDSLEPDFSDDNRHFYRELAYTYQNTGIWRMDRGNSISVAGFPAGQFILAHDLTPDLCGSTHLHASKTGNVIADFEWREELPSAISIYAYCVYECMYTHKAGTLDFELEYI